MSRKTLEVSTGYKPMPLQQHLHRSVKRFNVLVCHRGFGKTVFAVNELGDRALRNERHNPIYAYVATTFGQAKRVAWEHFKEWCKDIPGAETNESELKVTIPRPDRRDKITIFLLGSENPGALKGIHLDGAIIDEYSEMEPSIWGIVVRPMLTRKNGWAIFIGTPKGENHFAMIYNVAKTQMAQGSTEWFAQLYKASETGVIPPGELDAARLTMTEEEYAQEMECSFSAALVGAYYGKEMQKAEDEGRITKVAYDPVLPVTTFWDIGIDDATAIWFGQIHRSGQIHWIDYLENAGEGIPWYVKELQARGYIYDEHVLPHDAGAKEFGTGETREKTLRRNGLGARTRVLARSDVADGIHATRLMIGRSYFDVQKCARGILALKNYERKWDTKLKTFQTRPLHNWASHGSDAFRTAAMSLDQFSRDKRDERKYPRYSERDFDVI